jgi:hypothetical protein
LKGGELPACLEWRAWPGLRLLGGYRAPPPPRAGDRSPGAGYSRLPAGMHLEIRWFGCVAPD